MVSVYISQSEAESRDSFVLTSTKFAVFPSSSTPRVLNRVPARFHPKREIKAIVAMMGAPELGGAGSGTVKRPTYP